MDQTICYIGGGNILSNKMANVYKEIGKIIETEKLKNTLILVIPSNKQEKWIEISNRLFRSYGISDIVVGDPGKEPEKKILDKISQSDILFLTGGFPDQFLNLIHSRQNYLKVIKNNLKLIIGMSAGAVVLNKICFISADEDYPHSLIMKGLGLVDDFICEVHYSPDRYSIVKEALLLNDVIAISENSCLFYKNKKIKKIGKIIHFNRLIV